MSEAALEARLWPFLNDSALDLSEEALELRRWPSLLWDLVVLPLRDVAGVTLGGVTAGVLMTRMMSPATRGTSVVITRGAVWVMVAMLAIVVVAVEESLV